MARWRVPSPGQSWVTAELCVAISYSSTMRDATRVDGARGRIDYQSSSGGPTTRSDLLPGRSSVPRATPASGERPHLSFLLSVVVSWILTRALIFAVALGAVPYTWRFIITTEVDLYHQWSAVLLHGHFPHNDQTWQYPPGAAAVMLAPKALPTEYLSGFLALTCLADAVILLSLIVLTRRGESRAGAWAWVAAVPLLGPLCYGRFDIIVAALAVVALVVAGRPVVSGLLLAAGVMMKLWPALLLYGVPRGRRLWAHAGVVAVGCASIWSVAALLPGSSSFLEHQRGRGLQIESVPATAFIAARHLGWPVEYVTQFGAREVVGPGVQLAATTSLVVTLASLAGLIVWRRHSSWGPATAYDAVFVATMIVVVTSRVLSPQYMVWLAALAAVCLSQRHSSQHRVCYAVLGSVLLTQIVFPLVMGEIIDGRLGGAVWLVARNVLLVGATAYSTVLLWRSTRLRPTNSRGSGVGWRDCVAR